MSHKFQRVAYRSPDVIEAWWKNLDRGWKATLLGLVLVVLIHLLI